MPRARSGLWEEVQHVPSVGLRGIYVPASVMQPCGGQPALLWRVGGGGVPEGGGETQQVYLGHRGVGLTREAGPSPSHQHVWKAGEGPGGEGSGCVLKGHFVSRVSIIGARRDAGREQQGCGDGMRDGRGIMGT